MDNELTFYSAMGYLILEERKKANKMDNRLTTTDIVCSIICMVLSGILLIISI